MANTSLDYKEAQQYEKKYFLYVKTTLLLKYFCPLWISTPSRRDWSMNKNWYASGETINPQENTKTASSNNDKGTAKDDIDHTAANRIHFVATN